MNAARPPTTAAKLTPLAIAPAVTTLEVAELEEPVVVADVPLPEAETVAVPSDPGAVAVLLVVLLVGTSTGDCHHRNISLSTRLETREG